MKKKMRVLCGLLALVFLCGCAGNQEATTETQTPTQPTEPAPITTEESLVAAMAQGGRVDMEGDIQLTETLNVKGQIFDGGGYTLTGREHVKDDASTENALTIVSGTIQNLKIQGSYRCLADSKEHPASGDIRIRNVTADGETLALGISKGNGRGTLYVEDSVLLGWTLVGKLATVQFSNCTFGWNSNGTGGHFRNYVDTTMIGCRFEPKVDENGKQIPYNITFYSTTKGVTLYLENCYVGDTLITQENVSRLLKLSRVKDNAVVVRNTEV